MILNGVYKVIQRTYIVHLEDAIIMHNFKSHSVGKYIFSTRISYIKTTCIIDRYWPLTVGLVHVHVP